MSKSDCRRHLFVGEGSRIVANFAAIRRDPLPGVAEPCRRPTGRQALRKNQGNIFTSGLAKLQLNQGFANFTEYKTMDIVLAISGILAAEEFLVCKSLFIFGKGT